MDADLGQTLGSVSNLYFFEKWISVILTDLFQRIFLIVLSSIVELKVIFFVGTNLDFEIITYR